VAPFLQVSPPKLCMHCSSPPFHLWLYRKVIFVRSPYRGPSRKTEQCYGIPFSLLPICTAATVWQCLSVILEAWIPGYVHRHLRLCIPTFEVMYTNIWGYVHRHLRLCTPTFEVMYTYIWGYVHRHLRLCTPTFQVMYTDIWGYVHRHLRLCTPTFQVMYTDISSYVHRHFRLCTPTNLTQATSNKSYSQKRKDNIP